MNVLVVDRNVEIVERIKELLLEQENINDVVGLVCYKEAIEIFKSFLPEILVVDTSCSSDLSTGLINFVKQNNQSTVIIAISIYADPVSINRIKELGANFFLDKYLFSENISATLDEVKKMFKKLNPVYNIIS